MVKIFFRRDDQMNFLEISEGIYNYIVIWRMSHRDQTMEMVVNAAFDYYQEISEKAILQYILHLFDAMEVFVKYDENDRRCSDSQRAEAGFILRQKLETQSNVVVGLIKKSKLKELQNTRGVLRVWTDFQFNPCA